MITGDKNIRFQEKKPYKSEYRKISGKARIKTYQNRGSTE